MLCILAQTTQQPHWVTVLDSVPAPAWTVIGVVAGGALSAMGVLITVIISRRNLRLQLAHDREQRDNERRMHLRREVFLPAIGAIAKMVEFSGMFAAKGFDNAEFNERSEELNLAISKAEAVASAPTIRALSEFHRELTRLADAALRPRLAVKEQEHYADLAAEALRKQKMQLADAMSAARTARLGGDEAEAADQEQMIAALGVNFRKLAARHADHATEAQSLQLSLLRAIEPLIHNLHAASLPATIAIRSELGWPEDTAVFADEARKSRAIIDAFFERQLRAEEQRLQDALALIAKAGEANDGKSAGA